MELSIIKNGASPFGGEWLGYGYAELRLSFSRTEGMIEQIVPDK
jgi:hypothetical protein